MANTLSVAMRRPATWIMMALLVLAMVSFLVLGAYRASANSERYTFLVRGIVTDIDHASKNITVVGTHLGTATAGGQAKNDLLGSPIVYRNGTAPFFKWVKGEKKRMSFTKALPNDAIGAEVVIKGVARTGGHYNSAWVVVNDRSFDIKGKLKKYDHEERTMRILVGTSTYKQARYAKQELVFRFGSGTPFKTQGKEIAQDSVKADNQLVRVTGKIVGSDWKLDGFWDHVK